MKYLKLFEQFDFDDDEEEEEDENYIEIENFIEEMEANYVKYEMAFYSFVFHSIIKLEDGHWYMVFYDINEIDEMRKKNENVTLEQFLSKVEKVMIKMYNFTVNNVSIFNYRLSDYKLNNEASHKVTKIFLEHNPDMKNKMNIVYARYDMLICDENLNILLEHHPKFFLGEKDHYLIYYITYSKEDVLCKYVLVDSNTPAIVKVSRNLPLMESERDIEKVFNLINQN